MCLYKIDQPDMDRIFQLPPTTYIGGPERSLPLREIIHRLEVCHFVAEFFNSVKSVNQNEHFYSALKSRLVSILIYCA